MSKPWPKRAVLACCAIALLVFTLYSIHWKSRTPSEDALFGSTPVPQSHESHARLDASSPQKPKPETRKNDNEDASEEGKGSRITAEKRLERARHTLQGYLNAMRYPPSARPLSEMRELDKPHSVQPSKQPLSRPDRKRTDARVNLSQDRLYLVGDEAAALYVSCETSHGPAPCEVLSAYAGAPESMPESRALPTTPVLFADNGTNGDSAAGDGTMTALFAPGLAGYGGYHGHLFVDLSLRIEGEEGSARFELVYTPSPPARFTGKVREVMESGSLCLYLGMDVEKAGRYMIVGRVDSSDGDSFGYLEHNDLLPKGQTEAKMCIFGKLVHDEQAESPFVLRDVEGFLLKEDTYPDRELCEAKEGPYYTTKRYEQAAFSDEDWKSEEKSRHVEEFTKDVKEAEEALEDLD